MSIKRSSRKSPKKTQKKPKNKPSKALRKDVSLARRLFTNSKNEDYYAAFVRELGGCLSRGDDEVIEMSKSIAFSSSPDDFDSYSALLNFEVGRLDVLKNDFIFAESRIFCMPVIGVIDPNYEGGERLPHEILDKVTKSFKLSGAFGEHASIIIHSKLFSIEELTQSCSSVFNAHELLTKALNGESIPFDLFGAGEDSACKISQKTMPLRFLVGAIIDDEVLFLSDFKNIYNNSDDSDDSDDSDEYGDGYVDNFNEGVDFSDEDDFDDGFNEGDSPSGSAFINYYTAQRCNHKLSEMISTELSDLFQNGSVSVFNVSSFYDGIEEGLLDLGSLSITIGVDDIVESGEYNCHDLNLLLNADILNADNDNYRINAIIRNKQGEQLGSACVNMLNITSAKLGIAFNRIIERAFWDGLSMVEVICPDSSFKVINPNLSDPKVISS